MKPGLSTIVSKIEDEVNKTKKPLNRIYNELRFEYLEKLSNLTDRNIVLYYSGWLHTDNPDNNLYINDMDKIGFMSSFHDLDKDKGLDLILHTPGGNIAATESLVSYFRDIFGNNIRAIVPQIAMSAGTMIACSCCEIVMGKQSNLGPIDPQINNVPANGVTDEFEKAAEEIKKDPSKIPLWQTIISKYNPTFIGDCEKSIKWSNNMVRDWLVSNMLKDQDNSKTKVDNILKALSYPKDDRTHSRHISADKCKDMGLNINMMEDDQKLQDAIVDLHYVTMFSMQGLSSLKLIMNNVGNTYEINKKIIKK